MDRIFVSNRNKVTLGESGTKRAFGSGTREFHGVIS